MNKTDNKQFRRVNQSWSEDVRLHEWAWVESHRVEGLRCMGLEPGAANSMLFIFRANFTSCQSAALVDEPTSAH